MTVSADNPQLNKQAFRSTMSKFATGVAVLTAQSAGVRFGMTINSLTSVSLDPFQILVCTNLGSATGIAIRDSGSFAVNLLDRGQRDIASNFVGRNAGRFDATAFTDHLTGVPIIEGVLGSLVCRVNDIVTSGDHDVVIGDVIECWQREGEPLVFFAGTYGRFEADEVKLSA